MNHRDVRKRTALILASINGQLKAMETLLAAGESIKCSVSQRFNVQNLYPGHENHVIAIYGALESSQTHRL